MRVHLPLLWRMSLPAILLSLLLLGVGVAAGVYVYRWNAYVSGRLDRRVAGVLAAEELLLAVRDLRNDFRTHALQGSPASATALKAAANVARARLADLTDTEQDPALVQAIERDLADAIRVGSQAERVGQGELINALRRLEADALADSRELLEQNRTALAEDSAENLLLSRRVGVGIAALALCGGAAGLLTALGVARSVTRSVHSLGGSLHSLHQSLADAPGAGAAPGELRELLLAMGEVRERTEGMVNELQRSRQTAARADQLAAVGQLAAGIAHELRNPLTSIKLLADNAVEKAELLAPSDVAIVQAEATRMHNLLQSFLDFARPPAPTRERINLTDEIRAAVELARPRAERHSVSVSCRVAAGLSVYADRQQTRQVLLNLLLNAIEAQPGGGRVFIYAGHAGDKVVVEVADEGTGIAPDILPRLFEPFISSKETGMGLGLAISKRIVTTHGGVLVGENRPGAGALFRVILPAAVEAADAEPPTA